jgi:hypothetical protein
MSRSTFDGPILAGLNRLGPMRDVGYTDLVQQCDVNFTNTTYGTAGYSGASAQFVWGNAVPNVNGTLYTPQAGAFSNAGPVVALPTADSTGTTGTLYRGAVAYLPAGASINDIFIDCGVVPTVSGGTIGTISVNVGNQFNGTQYASVATVSSVGRQTLASFTDAQFIAQSSTTQDVQNPVVGQQPTWFSQVVLTVVVPYTGAASALTAGKFYFTVRYTQADGNIGTITVYPNGNFD